MSEFMSVGESLRLIGLGLLHLGRNLLVLGVDHALLLAWLAWALFAVNWQRTWHYLSRGAWAPVVLLLVVAALVWSQLVPSVCDCLGFPVGNFWWQLGAVVLIAALTLLCGWIQGYFQWTPPEIDLNPPGPSDHSSHHH